MVRMKMSNLRQKEVQKVETLNGEDKKRCIYYNKLDRWVSLWPMHLVDTSVIQWRGLRMWVRSNQCRSRVCWAVLHPKMVSNDQGCVDLWRRFHIRQRDHHWRHFNDMRKKYVNYNHGKLKEDEILHRRTSPSIFSCLVEKIDGTYLWWNLDGWFEAMVKVGRENFIQYTRAALLTLRDWDLNELRFDFSMAFESWRLTSGVVALVINELLTICRGADLQCFLYEWYSRNVTKLMRWFKFQHYLLLVCLAMVALKWFEMNLKRPWATTLLGKPYRWCFRDPEKGECVWMDTAQIKKCTHETWPDTIGLFECSRKGLLAALAFVSNNISEPNCTYPSSATQWPKTSLILFEGL